MMLQMDLAELRSKRKFTSEEVDVMLATLKESHG